MEPRVTTPPATPRTRSGVLSALGPGFLFAGASVGVSHLVQATRAGAEAGLALVGVVLLANLVKYVPFSFGPRYAAATGTSLLEGYRRRGRWAVLLYGLVTVGTMFTVQAAVLMVTASLLVATLGLELAPTPAAVLLAAGCAAFLLLGGFRWLDRAMKLVVSVLAVMTLAATVLIADEIDLAGLCLLPDLAAMDRAELLFLAALVGWMPAALDVSVWHSLWTVARGRSAGQPASVAHALLDFRIGYWLTALLAVCFVVLGAGALHSADVALSESPVGLARQVIDLYATALGPWARPLMGTCAVLVMLSTSLTVVDGFPRALVAVVASLRGGPEDGGRRPGAAGGRGARRGYWLALVPLAGGSLLLVACFGGSLPKLVDLATTLSFLTAPVLSWLNHRAALGEEVPGPLRPGWGQIAASWSSIGCQSTFALCYLAVRM
ncbi:MAG: divalent metal cation transporter [Planctomycetota bacterium]